jgi:hypothetical protein
MPPEELCRMVGKPMEMGRAVARTGKQKKGKKSKGKAAKRATGEDTLRVDDSDVESELEKLVRLDDEEEEEGPPEAAHLHEQQNFGIDQGTSLTLSRLRMQLGGGLRVTLRIARSAHN